MKYYIVMEQYGCDCESGGIKFISEDENKALEFYMKIDDIGHIEDILFGYIDTDETGKVIETKLYKSKREDLKEKRTREGKEKTYASLYMEKWMKVQ